MKSKSITELARNEIKDLEPCIHGGDIWKSAREYGLHYENILDFSANVNPLGPSRKAMEAIKNSFWQIPFYPDSNSTALREAISHHIEEVNVIAGNGSTELIYLFSEVFIEKGEESLIPAPTFGEYENAVRKVGGKTRHIKSNLDFTINLTNVLKEIRPATKAIFLCNPNNPTSTLIPKENLLEMIEEASKEHVLVFLDEDFMEFVDEGRRFSLASEVETYQNLFILRSFTKVFGLTGLRVGYGIACEEIINLLLKAKIPWNVNCLAQAAAIVALRDVEYLEKTRGLISEEKPFLLNKLRQIKDFKVFPAHANFIFIDVRQTGFTAAQLKEKMLKYEILIRDCSSFRGLDEYYIRVAIRTRQDNEKLLAVLKKLIGGS